MASEYILLGGLFSHQSFATWKKNQPGLVNDATGKWWI